MRTNISMTPARRYVSVVVLAALACVVLHGSNAFALDPKKSVTQYVQTTWTADQGLPSGRVLSIAQTPDGYLWIATMLGLVRFDGAQFKVFDTTTTRALKHDYIWTLFVDKDGALWVGTYGGGLARYKDGVFSAYGEEQGLSDPVIRAITQSADGAIWIGTNSGLNRLKDGRFTVYTTAD